MEPRLQPEFNDAAADVPAVPAVHRVGFVIPGSRHPNSGLPEFGNIIVQVGNSRLGCARRGMTTRKIQLPGIHGW
jgi:hypothetical protein